MQILLKIAYVIGLGDHFWKTVRLTLMFRLSLKIKGIDRYV